jgi:hypothetical protein
MSVGIAFALAAMVVGGFAGSPASVRGADAPPAAPNSAGKPTKEQKVTKLLDYLEGEYAKKTTSPYWVTRAMGTISLARSPRPQATSKLFDVLEKDKHEVVRLLAWEGLLARCENMDSKSFTRLSNATLIMAEKDLFRGGLRVPLLKVMACNAPNPRWKKVWEKIFTECNAWEPEDIPVLDALGACEEQWRSPNLIDGLINLLTETNMALRAEIVLRRAGAPVRTTISTLAPEIFDPMSPKRSHPSWADLWQTTRREYEKWWGTEKIKWKETRKPEGPVWKDLKPAYVAAPFALDAIDPEDKFWYRDLELGKADLAQFEAAFLVDATGSMGDVLDWLKRDLGRMAMAFGMLCKEPVALGVTFYRDYDCPWVVKMGPLTTKLQTLEPLVTDMTADGGGDIPEAILPGLKDTLEKNKWTKRTKSSSKVIILIGDAPPHSNELEQIITLAKKCPENGMKIYAAKVKTELGRNDLSDFDEIAKAAGGATVDVEFRRGVSVRYVDMVGHDIPYKTMERPEAQLIVASAELEPPGEKIMNLVITDTISPQFRDRVEPLSRTLLAYCAKPSKPEVRRAFPANTPPLQKGMLKPQ